MGKYKLNKESGLDAENELELSSFDVGDESDM